MPPSDNWWIVLADFGISKRAGEDNGPTTAIKSTEGFMAPELLGFPNLTKPKNISSSKATDMWALGEIVFRMLAGEATFLSMYELMAYCQGQQAFPSDRLPPSTGYDGKEFISSLMKIHPSDRMTTSQGLIHSWMKSQELSIEDEFSSLNMGQTNAAGIIQPDTVEEASARWTTLSDAESKSVRTVKQIPPNILLSYQGGPEQTQREQRYRDSLTQKDRNTGLETRMVWQMLKGHPSVSSVAFSPDSKTLASAKTHIKLWDSRSGEVLQTLKGHTSHVCSVAFSPDGKTLASASDDRTIRLWDARSGAALQVLSDHAASVEAVAFSPDGKTLVSGSGDGTIRLLAIVKSGSGH